LGVVESKTNKTLTFPLSLQFDTINIEEGGGDRCCSSKRGVGRRNCIRPTSNHHEVSIRLNDANMNMILTFPSSLWSLTIDIDQGGEVWGVPRSSGRRDQPRNCGSHPVKH
jgi:hypothetical protein